MGHARLRWLCLYYCAYGPSCHQRNICQVVIFFVLIWKRCVWSINTVWWREGFNWWFLWCGIQLICCLTVWLRILSFVGYVICCIFRVGWVVEEFCLCDLKLYPLPLVTLSDIALFFVFHDCYVCRWWSLNRRSIIKVQRIVGVMDGWSDIFGQTWSSLLI